MAAYFSKNSINLIIISMFLITIFAPCVIGFIEKDKNFSMIENRKLAGFPTIDANVKFISRFPKLFETYYSDHFGLRDFFAGYYKLLKFKLGDSPSNDVTIGKDGWLFLGSVRAGKKEFADPIGDFRNVNLYSDCELKRIALYMTYLDSWLKDKGIQYFLVIAPNKHTIYFDKLPEYITKANQHSATDQLIEHLTTNTNIIIVDLRDVLIQEKCRHQLYFKTDTHWNHFGANIAQYRIMQEIEKLFPDQISPELFPITVGDRMGGDLARFIGLENIHESNPQPVFNEYCKPVKHPHDTKLRDTHTYICEEQSLKAVIFRDSFFSALQPYFARKFKRSTYIWKRLNFSILKKHINSEKPDVIIEEWVERALPFVPIIPPELELSYNRKISRKVADQSS